jgi:hypothetical protein
MAQQIKGIVPPPFQMPAELQRERSRLAVKQVAKAEVPLLITLFAWYCFTRAAGDLVFVVLARLAPESPVTTFVIAHFDPVSPPFPPEFAFLVLALLYIMVGWRWITRDWRARWAAMFISAITAASSAYQWITDRPIAIPAPGAPGIHQAPVISLVVNVAVCCYLAFYPGMADSFKETEGK